MDPVGIIIWLAIGALSGWLAGALYKGFGFGVIGNIIIGIIGSVVGGYVFGMLGIQFNGLIGSIITAVAGAVLLLFVIGFIKRKV